MLLEPVRPFIAAEYRVKLATEAWERRGAARLRRQVFCEEQKVFEGDDRDAIDETAIPIVALACMAGNPDMVAGTVRIHQPEPGLWYGSRLAVDAEYRRVGPLGASLIRLAVCTATARGCLRFLAHVQSRNALLFRRLHWKTLEEVTLHGLPHHVMQADLAHYQPFPEGDRGFVQLTRSAA